MLKLPELPQIKLLRTVMPDDYRYGHVHGYTHKDMKAYGRACADAALEAAAVVCDQLDVMSLDPEVCYGSAKECAEAIRVLKEQA